MSNTASATYLGLRGLGWIFLSVLMIGQLGADSRRVSSLVVVGAPNESGYAAHFGDDATDGRNNVIEELRSRYTAGGRLVLLVGPDVPTRAITTVLSIASKVGYLPEDVRVFLFDKQQNGMIAVSLGRDFVEFETDPIALERFF